MKTLANAFLRKAMRRVRRGSIAFALRRLYLAWNVYLESDSMVPRGGTVVHIGVWRIETVVEWSRAVGPSGRVIIIEALPQNVDILRFEIARRGLANVTLVHSGVWYEKATIPFKVHCGTRGEGDDEVDTGRKFIWSSPVNASTFIDEESPEAGAEFEQVDIPANTLENILAGEGVTSVDHVQVTVTGSEREVLRGLTGMLDQPGISLLVSATFLDKDTGKPACFDITASMQDRGLRTCMGRRVSGHHGRYVYARREAAQERH